MKPALKRTVIAAAIAAAAILIGAAFLAARAIGRCELTFESADGSTVFLRLPARDGLEFSVTFTHSVNATDVTEIYEVRDGEIRLTGCVYYSFGAGVATEIEDGWTLTYGDDGSMVISDIDLPMTELIYAVGTVSDHTLRVGEDEYSLRDLCGRNTSVRISIR